MPLSGPSTSDRPADLPTDGDSDSPVVLLPGVPPTRTAPPPLARRTARQRRSALTHDLLEQAAGEPDGERRRALLDDVVVANRGVAEAVAARYRGRGIALEDLEQVACEALVKAVRRFDPSRHRDLLSYAVPTIRGELLRHFRDHGWTVRPPRRVQELQWQITRATRELEGELGREPLQRELVERLGVEVDAYREALEAFGCFAPTSLDQPLTATSTTTIGELIPEPDDALATSDLRLDLSPAVDRLDERDRRILRLRFVDDRTQREIGDLLGITQVQVSRLLSAILLRLRGQLETQTDLPDPHHSDPHHSDSHHSVPTAGGLAADRSEAPEE